MLTRVRGLIALAAVALAAAVLLVAGVTGYARSGQTTTVQRLANLGDGHGQCVNECTKRG